MNKYPMVASSKIGETLTKEQKDKIMKEWKEKYRKKDFEKIISIKQLGELIKQIDQDWNIWIHQTDKGEPLAIEIVDGYDDELAFIELD